MDRYEYVMHGRVFKLLAKGSKLQVFASFGGLLMCLTANPPSVKEIQLDQRMYLLISKQAMQGGLLA